MDAQPESQIINAVLDAISEQRLPAGAKLGEQPLSDLFNCNRANVRRALASLAAQHVVVLRPNRGAFVVAPSAEEAREVFEARRTIEEKLGRQAVHRVTNDDIARLRANIAAETAAREARDKPTELRTSQQFHMYIARLAGNRVLERFLAELTMRSTLILGMYSRGGSGCAGCRDHNQIVDALMARDEGLLVRLIDEHLRYLEAELDFGRSPIAPGSLREQLLGMVPGQ